METVMTLVKSPLFWMAVAILVIWWKRDVILDFLGRYKFIIIVLIFLLVYLSGKVNLPEMMRGAIPDVNLPRIGIMTLPQLGGGSDEIRCCGMDPKECINSGGTPNGYCPQGCCPYGYRNQGAGYTHLCACKGDWVPCTNLDLP